MRAVSIAVVAVAASLCANAAAAGVANVVVNGGFNTDLANWTSTCDVSTSTTLVGAGEGFLNPSEGSSFAFQGKDNTNGSCVFYQDVAIPATATAATLTLDVGVSGSNANPNPSLDTVSVDVKTTSNVQIANVFSGQRSSYRDVSPAPSVNLLAQAGTTVRIVMTVTRASGGGIVVAGLDNVVLKVTTPDPASVPTLGEWAMILFGATLAGLAGLTVIRRRRVA